MTWLADNLLALFALAFSAGSLFASGFTLWRTRHRVTVACRTATVALPGVGGATENHTYVVVTVRNVGRPVAVEEVSFERVHQSQDESNAGWGSVPRAVRYALPVFEMPPGFGTESPRLEDGESAKWACSLGWPFDPSDLGEPFDLSRLPKPSNFRAVLILANGKTVRSEPFWHLQTPESGWAFAPDAQPVA